jgi:2-polyprenyl-3-methyl-5-hydroxy-6-metoxy-1,4-benzoquinol methylase
MNVKHPSWEQEKAFLKSATQTYTLHLSPQMKAMRQLVIRTVRPYLRGGHGLELGSADGSMTELLLEAGVAALDVVEGSEEFARQTQSRNLPNVRLVHSLFEEFEPERCYDYIFALYVLEHVLDPASLLARLRPALQPEGLLFVVVPNARALSRQLAVHMDLLSHVKELTPNDHQHGHRRVYDRVELNRQLDEAGFSTLHQGGILLKVLADFQLDQLLGQGFLNEKQMEGWYRLGLEYPDFCGSLFSICQAA